MPSADLLSDLAARGLLHDHTDAEALRSRLAEGPVGLYHGMDPTAPSLHVGNLLGLVVLRRFQLAGHRPIALVGGATGMIGDPSGRSSERNLLDEETLARNVASVAAQVQRLLPAADGVELVELVDNADWTREVTLVAFLRSVGKMVTVNQMVAKESVKARMASSEGISFTEFAYLLLQANDFAWLHRHRGCDLQIGGSDQWGNITAGIDLIRRQQGDSVHGLTWPLLTKADGAKFGKSQDGNVWLDPAFTSPYRFHQFWMQISDADVGARLAQFTLLGVDEVARIMAEHEAAPSQRRAQRRLAAELTTWVHGSAAREAAEEAAAALFGGDVATISEAALEAVAGEVPTTEAGQDLFDVPVEAADLLVRAGLVASKGEARRVLRQKGAYLFGVALGEDDRVDRTQARYGRYLLLRRGKRTHALVRLSA